MAILKLLPKTNCCDCGQPTCMVFASLAVEGVKGPDDCPPLDDRNRAEIARYLKQFVFELQKVKGEITMNGERKNTEEEFFNCCEGMDFAEMMRKMMGQQGGCHGFDCAEMMQKMMTMYCRPGEEKEETTEEV